MIPVAQLVKRAPCDLAPVTTVWIRRWPFDACFSPCFLSFLTWPASNKAMIGTKNFEHLWKVSCEVINCDDLHLQSSKPNRCNQCSCIALKYPFNTQSMFFTLLVPKFLFLLGCWLLVYQRWPLSSYWSCSLHGSLTTCHQTQDGWTWPHPDTALLLFWKTLFLINQTLSVN